MTKKKDKIITKIRDRKNYILDGKNIKEVSFILVIGDELDIKSHRQMR